MKKLLFIAFLSLSFSGFAQEFTLGPKFGLSSTKMVLYRDNFIPGDAQIGYHVGLFTRISFGGFFIQPEALYTKTNGSFQINSPQPGGGTGTSTFSEDFNRLDIPVMLGFRFLKILRLQAGPIASININSELRDASNTIQDVDYENANLGYQAGIGLDIGNFILDAKYESSLTFLTKKIGGFQADQRINQFILSVGFKLF